MDWKKADTANGKALFGELRCVSCHAVNGRGGTMGPELSRVGDKVRRDWLFSYLKDPHREQPDTAMLQYRLTDGQVRDVTAFLLEEYRTSGAEAEAAPAPYQDARRGGGRTQPSSSAAAATAATSSPAFARRARSGRAWPASPTATPTSSRTAASPCGGRPTTTSS